MRHKTEIKMRLSIYGDTFDPEELTNLLDIKPTHIQIRGKKIPLQPGLQRMPGKPEPIYKETAWDYSTGFIKTSDSEDVSIIIEKIFKSKIHLIKEFILKYNLQVCLLVAPYMDKRLLPSIHFSPSFLKLLNELNADIDIDLCLI